MFVATHVLLPWIAAAQGLTGTLVGTVKDHQGGAVVGALVEINSPALIGGPGTTTTNSKGQLRFTNLPPGAYVIVVAVPGFTTYRGQDVLIGVSVDHRDSCCPAACRRQSVRRSRGHDPRAWEDGTRAWGLALAPRISPRSRLDDPGLFDWIRAAPGISPTSPSSGTINTISAFGSSTNENTFLIDGTDFTSPSNGAARADPGVDFMQEVHVQSVGASVEYGNVQGAVVNVVTRQGGNRFLCDASYYGQTASLTSQPMRLPVAGAGELTSGYAAREVPRLHDKPRRSRCSRSVVVFRGIPVPAGLRQPAWDRSRHSPGCPRRTTSLRSSPGGWLRAGSWSRAFTTSSGSTQNNPRLHGRSKRPCACAGQCRLSPWRI